MVSVADYGPRGSWFAKGSLVRDLAAAQFFVALSKSHLPTAYYWFNPGSRGRTTRTNCDETGDYVVPNVLSPRDLVSRSDNMDETVLYHRTVKPELKVTASALLVI